MWSEMCEVMLCGDHCGDASLCLGDGGLWAGGGGLVVLSGFFIGSLAVFGSFGEASDLHDLYDEQELTEELAERLCDVDDCCRTSEEEKEAICSKAVCEKWNFPSSRPLAEPFLSTATLTSFKLGCC